ncbi:MAG: hypothetical protein A2W91_20520 [Bacteroidetes bacterium GWF2_38_335]|nr:MAG: hypothetical protein A2W91_20520 [Bacteroidetes bacterium GWF2_38_335]OFY79459.1 MAG: hypothetical protein A2281_13565 [Bacteroidetes bacterium RIFOXYA12_FULL_38_20]HBS86605.1 hypothetical protein [Bacteroidales bacterium]
METTLIDNPPKSELNVKYAGFGIRLLAFLIDSVIYFGIAYLIWGDQVVKTSGSGFSAELNDEKALIVPAYFLLFWLLTSTSPGKFICGLKLIGNDGKKIKPLSAFIRMVVYVVMVLGCWFILFNKKKTALHDIAAGTFVIHR